MSQADARPLVSLVVPAYNEAGILEKNLTRLCEYMDTLAENYRWEMLVVNDGSTDETGKLAEAFAATRENVRVLHHRVNFRLGQALRYGFSQCRGDYVVVFDIDLTYSPDHIQRLLDHIRTTGARIVLASPYMKGGKATSVPFLRRMFSRWGNRFLALTARGANPAGNVSTLTGMVRAYDGRFLRSLNLKSMGMEINTEVIYKALILGARVEEIPAHLDWSEQQDLPMVRTSGKRIGRGIVFGLLSGFIIRPFAFFIIPGLLLGLVSLYVVTWIGIHVYTHSREIVESGRNLDFLLSESIARAFDQAPHAFVVGGISLVLAIQLLSLGVLALQAKQYFEELFHFGTRIYSKSQEIERLLARRIDADVDER